MPILLTSNILMFNVILSGVLKLKHMTFVWHDTRNSLQGLVAKDLRHESSDQYNYAIILRLVGTMQGAPSTCVLQPYNLTQSMQGTGYNCKVLRWIYAQLIQGMIMY